MALANDNWYGYVQEIIARLDVRWIECACASLCWTTQIIYQLEEPYGHLMQESMQGSQSRIAARGNVFSFLMPYGDILRNLEKATNTATRVPLPHDGSVLAILLRVHIIGRSIDITQHLRDVHIRPDVVRQLLEELINRGFPGYDKYDIDEVRQRTKELYGDESKAAFIPTEIVKEMQAASTTDRKRKRRDEPYDKNATPAEPPMPADSAFAALRPQEIVAERHSDAGRDVNASHAGALGRFGTLEVEMDSTMMHQWKADYLCATHPFTLALPVGGYDLKKEGRWRRPAEAARVGLADLVRGLPRRVEGQFRRHWTCVPLLWNLFFRDRVHSNASLGLKTTPKVGGPQEVEEEEAAVVAARCYQRLNEGYFKDADGKRKPICGDTSKLLFATGTTAQERELLREMHFTTRSLPGTQEIRRQMGHVCFAARIVYGSGIFMTISPSERHNGLAIRLSRYRRNDPLVHPAVASEERKWIGQDEPSLETSAGNSDEGEDEFEEEAMDFPDYDLRRLILARDPLCAVDAFTILIRVVLAKLLGMRMCPDCPHCNKGKHPCQDAFGCNAEPQGGICGRCDALFGAVETQRSGTLHLHFFVFLQRAHQHKTLKEIAEMIEQDLLTVDELKEFHCRVCDESYPDPKRQKRESEDLEKQWPTFRNDKKLGRIPAFIWGDEGPCLGDGRASQNELVADGKAWLASYEAAAQHNMARLQHHMHKRGEDGERHPLPACRSTAKPDQCKHDMPMDKRLTDRPLLVCPGIAEDHGLRVTGQRSALGTVLGKRNNEWLTGSARGLVVGFGCNTHTGPNDRLPITAKTHERACKRQCVKAGSVALIARKTQCSQTQQAGYIGGYMCKVQPAGRYEMQKCIQKMYTLREHTKDWTPKDQAKAAVRRMITDLEMKGTLRGAAEVFNLCVNLRSEDSLFQECIRTFMTVAFPGSAFLHRLELELDGVGCERVSTRIPPTRRPAERSKGSTPPIVDIYGFRGQDPRVALLSPFSFLMYWSAEPVLPPHRQDNACKRSEWCKDGEEYYEAHKHDPHGCRLRPGFHYRVIEPSDDYLVFPNDKVLATFRHRWVLVRNPRPMVPVFQHSKLPGPRRTSEENARLSSVYFRPWTLHAGHAMLPHVPHLLQLGMYPEPAPSTNTVNGAQQSRARADTAPESDAQTTKGDVVFSEAPPEAAPLDTGVRRRLTKKTCVGVQPPDGTTLPSQCPATPTTKRRVSKKSSEGHTTTLGENTQSATPNEPLIGTTVITETESPTGSLEPTWAASWGRYIRGNVVSRHDAQLITNFLTATLARTAGDDDSSDEEAEDLAEFEGEPICTSLEDVHALIRWEDAPEHADANRSNSRQQRARAIRRVRSAWSSELTEETAGNLVDTRGNVPNLGVLEYRKEIRKVNKAEDQPPMPFQGKAQPRARVYEHGSMADIDRWLRSFEALVPTTH